MEAPDAEAYAKKLKETVLYVVVVVVVVVDGDGNNGNSCGEVYCLC